jgi:hypothetical protein
VGTGGGASAGWARPPRPDRHWPLPVDMGWALGREGRQRETDAMTTTAWSISHVPVHHSPAAPSTHTHTHTPTNTQKHTHTFAVPFFLHHHPSHFKSRSPVARGRARRRAPFPPRSAQRRTVATARAVPPAAAAREEASGPTVTVGPARPARVPRALEAAAGRASRAGSGGGRRRRLWSRTRPLGSRRRPRPARPRRRRGQRFCGPRRWRMRPRRCGRPHRRRR